MPSQRKAFEPIFMSYESLRNISCKELYEDFRVKLGTQTLSLKIRGGEHRGMVFCPLIAEREVEELEIPASVHCDSIHLLYKVSGWFEPQERKFDPHELLTRTEMVMEIMDRWEFLRAKMNPGSANRAQVEAELLIAEHYLKGAYTVHELGGIEAYRGDIENAADSLQMP